MNIILFLYKYTCFYTYIDLHRKKFEMKYSKIFSVVMVTIRKAGGTD